MNLKSRSSKNMILTFQLYFNIIIDFCTIKYTKSNYCEKINIELKNRDVILFDAIEE